MTTRVDTGSVQGNVLRSYGREFSHTTYVFLKLVDPGDRATKETLAKCLGKVSFDSRASRTRGRRGEPHVDRASDDSAAAGADRPAAAGADHAAGATDQPAARPGPADIGPGRKLNIAFTYNGLKALKIPGDILDSFPTAFRMGAKERAPHLGDRWQNEGCEPLHESHLLLSIHTRCVDAEHDRCVKDVTKVLHEQLQMREESFKKVHRLDAAQSKNQREAFGFKDGFSQPAIEGVDVDAVGRGVYVGTEARGGMRRRADLVLENLTLASRQHMWRPIRTGEFLLGYENEDGELPAGPPSPWGPNGTFMVYREFDQDVGGFKDFIERSAKAHGLAEDAIRAKIVGRWPDGDPAVRPRPDLELQYRCPKCEAQPGHSCVENGKDVRSHPERLEGQYPCPKCKAEPGHSCVDAGKDGRSHPERIEVAITLSGSRTRLNDFHYAEDPNGWGCPLAAHVRRTNPRDSLPGGGEQTMRHRIIRRGMPFDRGGDPNSPEREGLAFVCLSASIEDGFEFIQRNWINNGAAFGLGATPDFLLHTSANQNKAKMVIPGFRPTVLSAPPQPFVTVRACEYLFVPSRVACAALAAFLVL